MSQDRSAGAPLRLWAGVLAQATALRVSTRRPGAFWPLMTAALCGSALLVGTEGPAPGPRRPGWGWRMGLAVGGVDYLLVLAAARVAVRLRLAGRSLDRLRRQTSSVGMPLRAALVIPAAVSEEWFWRQGVLNSGLVGPAPPGVAQLLPTTLLYALVQASSLDLPEIAGALLLGASTGVLRVGSGSMVGPVAAHLAFSELTLAFPGLPAPSREAGRPGTEP